MRAELEGTVAVGELRDDRHLYEGKTETGAWARTFPAQVKIEQATIDRGHDRFNIYCTPCHGYTGEGDGMVTRRAEELGETTWARPAFLVQNPALDMMPVGQIYGSITNGIKNMPAYRNIDTEDRWAIVLYLRALSRSRTAKVADVPEEARGSL